VTRGALSRAGGFLVVLAVLPLAMPQHWVVSMLVFTVMYAALASSWNLIGGYAGYPSLGHAAFFGFGAYTVALVYPSSHTLSNGLLPFAILPVVAVAAALIGLPIGAIAMRTRADVFAIVTITLLFVAQTLAFNLRSLTGGAQGAGVAIPPFDVGTFERPFYYAMCVLLLVAMGASWYSRNSKIGLSLAAVRADEDKARGIGVHVAGVKLLAFSVSVGITAMVGAVWAYYVNFVYPQFAFDPLITIGMVLMAFLGGRGTLWGPVVGAVILVPAQQYLAYELGGSQLYLVAYALVFLLIMRFMPRGVLPTISDIRRRRRLTAAADNDPPVRRRAGGGLGLATAGRTDRQGGTGA
jgi:branched-chain amino acid transport system permease protein